MKKIYETPASIILAFAMTDVITVSDGTELVDNGDPFLRDPEWEGL